jgi:Ca2+-binding RTX toxin-like protein
MPLTASNAAQVVNTATSGNQLGSQVVKLADGSMVVAWQDQSSGNLDIKFQRYDALGNRIGGETLAHAASATDQKLPALAALPGGGFVVTWVEGTTSAVFAQKFSAAGAPVGGVITVGTIPWNAAGTNAADPPVVQGLAGDAFAVFHKSDGNTVAHVVNAAGVSGSNFFTQLPSRDFIGYPDIALDASGYMAVVYNRPTGPSSSQDVFVRFYNPQGLPVTLPVGVNSWTNGLQYSPSISRLTDGNYIVTWTGAFNTTGFETSVVGQLIDASGNRIGSGFKVGQLTGLSESVGLPNGKFLIVYLEQPSGALRAQLYNNNGTLSGPEILVSSTAVAGTPEIGLTVLADGRVSISWADTTGDGSGTSVKVQIFDPRDSTVGDGSGNDTIVISGSGANAPPRVVDGGAGTDTLNFSGFAEGLWVDYTFQGDATWSNHQVWSQTAGVWHAIARVISVENFIGSNFNDWMRFDAGDNVVSGMGGDDQIYGNAGNDTLDGGAGNDSVYGDAGNDRLIAGSGADLLFGGDGADIFVFSGGEAVGLEWSYGDAGTDVADFSAITTSMWVDLTYTEVEAWTNTAGAYARLSYLRGIENIVGSSNADAIYGDAKANQISGGDGADFVQGRAGNDVLMGEGGNDRLYGGDNNDKLSGGLGADELYGEANDDTFLFANNGGTDWTDGGSGSDTADFSGLTTYAWVDLALAGTEAWTFTSGWNVVSRLISVENLTGTALNDQLWGDAQNNIFIGGAGSDRLTGRAGSDTFKFDARGFGQDVVMDYADGTDRLSFGSTVATTLSNFTITGQGTTQVYMVLNSDPTNTITLNGAAPITITNADIDYFA